MFNQKVNNPIAVILGAVLFLVLYAYFFDNRGVEKYNTPTMQTIEKDASESLDKIKQKVASDAVEQYGIAKRSGTPMDVCVQAGLVSAAYLQAKDELQYRHWKQTENNDCAKVGLHR